MSAEHDGEAPSDVQATRRRGGGFASMDPAKRSVLASKGGRAAHAAGTAHQFTPEEARAAGRKGGLGRRCKLTGKRVRDCVCVTCLPR